MMYIHINTYTCIHISGMQAGIIALENDLKRYRKESEERIISRYQYEHRLLSKWSYTLRYVDSLMPLASLHFCVGLDFVTPLL
jgi:flavin-dependent dehydrogenase